MKIFISWSDNSLAIAKTIKYLINLVWDEVDVFVSDEDMRQGGFYEQICEEAQKADALIACFTKENKMRSWLYFESAIVLMNKPKRVIPFCYNLNVSETSMLARCQGIKYDVNSDEREEALKRLLVYINNIILEVAPGSALPRKQFYDTINQHLKKIRRKLDLIHELNQTYNYFISYPIKGSKGSKENDFDLKTLLDKVKNKFEAKGEKMKIFHAVGMYQNDSELETYDTLRTIEASKHFILILPLDISVSSVFVEVGVAIAGKKNITIFRETDEKGNKAYLPFILERQIEDKKDNTLIEYQQEDLEEMLMEYIEKDFSDIK